MTNEQEDLRERVIGTIKECYDPEIPVNIYDLGLIYKVEVEEGGIVKVVMTLTSPMCPVAESLPADVQSRIMKLDEVKDVHLEVVFDPPWDKEMMSEEAKFILDIF